MLFKLVMMICFYRASKKVLALACIVTRALETSPVMFVFLIARAIPFHINAAVAIKALSAIAKTASCISSN